MPQVEITIGGRSFEVACQEGEEAYLQSAAAMLDAEASTLSSQIGRMPETRMLLMAGLMLADKTAGLEDQLQQLEAHCQQIETELEALRRQPVPEPQRIEVPVIPAAVADGLAELTAQAEALATEIEEKTAS